MAKEIKITYQSKINGKEFTKILNSFSVNCDEIDSADWFKRITLTLLLKAMEK